MLKYAAAALCVAVGVAAGCGGSDKKDEPEGPQKLSVQQLVKQGGLATVKLYGKWGETTTGGTGVVIDAKKGYILTNAHVVDGTTGLKARINDEATDYTARIRATAPCDDLALVEFPNPPAGIKAMALGNSGKVKSGQHVTTLGYPSTLDESEVAGGSKLVYADGRVSTPETSSNLPGLGEYQSLIQHTAAANPGNSGGPLVDDFGRLLGINTLGNSGQAGEVQNQFYSITIDHAKPIIEKLTQGISVADVGWTVSEPYPELMRALFEAEGVAAKYGNIVYREIENEPGLLVLDARAATPAGRSGFIQGDYITHIEGNRVSTQSDVCDAFESATPGSVVKVKGMWLSSALASDDPDIHIYDSFEQNVRVPEEEEVK